MLLELLTYLAAVAVGWALCYAWRELRPMTDAELNEAVEHDQQRRAVEGWEDDCLARTLQVKPQLHARCFRKTEIDAAERAIRRKRLNEEAALRLERRT